MTEKFRPLRRLPTVGWISGVCAGIAYSIGAPTWLVRLVTVALVLAGVGSGILLYLLFWIFLPVEPVLPPDYAQRTGDVSAV
jgi:phage shock protein PspC (stress-responsive transcriptional regulator)